MNVGFSWKVTVVGAIALFGASSAGCKRSVCEPAPLDEFWTAHKDVVPPGATVCNAKPVEGTAYLELDFADDPNPFVTITKHLEDKGFRRVSQDIKDPKIQSMMVEKGKPGADLLVIGINLALEDGRWHASMHTELPKK